MKIKSKTTSIRIVFTLLLTMMFLINVHAVIADAQFQFARYDNESAIYVLGSQANLLGEAGNPFYLAVSTQVPDGVLHPDLCLGAPSVDDVPCPEAYVTCYVDYNQSGIFEEAEIVIDFEPVTHSHSAISVEGSVPDNAVDGERELMCILTDESGETVYDTETVTVMIGGEGTSTGPTCSAYESSDVPVRLDIDDSSISSLLSIESGIMIGDIDVDVDMTHDWVGDVVMTLAHSSGTSVTLIDRPGVPGSEYGCSNNDIVARLDDEATAGVESACDTRLEPAIDGMFKPEQALSAFDGLDSSGEWTLTVEDAVSRADGGVLNSWSLEICTEDEDSVEVPFFDDFETDKGWVVNPNGTDDAEEGGWERGDPEESTIAPDPVAIQLGDTPSGQFALVTGASGGLYFENDVDRGTTSVVSPAIELPVSNNLTLSFWGYYATILPTEDDFFRVTIIGETRAVLVEESYATNDVTPGEWKRYTEDISEFSGQTVQILFEAADRVYGSTIEAAVDDVSVSTTMRSSERSPQSMVDVEVDRADDPTAISNIEIEAESDDRTVLRIGLIIVLGLLATIWRMDLRRKG